MFLTSLWLQFLYDIMKIFLTVLDVGAYRLVTQMFLVPLAYYVTFWWTIDIIYYWANRHFMTLINVCILFDYSSTLTSLTCTGLNWYGENDHSSWINTTSTRRIISTLTIIFIRFIKVIGTHVITYCTFTGTILDWGPTGQISFIFLNRRHLSPFWPTATTKISSFEDTCWTVAGYATTLGWTPVDPMHLSLWLENMWTLSASLLLKNKVI